MSAVCERPITRRRAALLLSSFTVAAAAAYFAWLHLPHGLIILGTMGAAAAAAGLAAFAFPRYALYFGIFWVYAGLAFYTSLPIPAAITLAVALAVALELMRGDRIQIRDPLFLWSISVFALLAIQSMLFAHYHAYSLWNFFSFAKSALLVFLIGQLVRREKDLETLAFVVFAGALASVVLGAVNNTLGIYNEAQSTIGSWQRFGGTHINANRAAHFFVAGLPLGVYAVKRAKPMLLKLTLVAATVVLALAVVLTFSRQTIFPLVIILLAVLFKEARSKWIYALVLGVVGVALFFIPGMYWHRITTIGAVFDAAGQEWSLAVRLEAFKAAWRMFLEHPFTGVGLNNFIVRSPLIVRIGAHNAYLEILAGVGIFGLIAFVAVMGSAVRGYARAMRARWSAESKWMSDLSFYFLLSCLALLISIFFEQTHFDREVWVPVAAGLIAGRMAGDAALSAPPERKPET